MAVINNIHKCTIGTCPLSLATVHYVPNLGGNAFFCALFAFLLLIHIGQVWRYQTFSFSILMIVGFLLEILGYVGRIGMHHNPFEPNPFLIYIICLTIGPVFFAASIYLTLSRIIVHYGPEHSRFPPKTITLFFVSCDFIALVLQAVGGAIADTADTKAAVNAGTHTMVAGLSFQVLCLLIFVGISSEFVINVRRARRREKPNGSSERSFKLFLHALVFATVFILTRSCFRVAELSKGFGGKLANEEIPFMILEGSMVSLATILMTAFHPGRAFGAKWQDAGWNWKKGQVGYLETQQDGTPLHEVEVDGTMKS